MASNIITQRALAPVSAHTLVMGRATPAGTRRYRKRFADHRAPDFFKELDGLSVSSLGLGTYLGEPSDADDERYVETVAHALARGVNVLDTAINYRCQRSERAVGAGLAQALERRTVSRDEIALCTKGGYIPLEGSVPPTREAYLEYLEREYFARGLMQPDEVVGGGHCLASRFLADQIVRSRRNLRLETLDVYYLHNPEQQLEAVSPAKFLSRMHDAFVLLEDRVKRGDIARYGIATWDGLRAPAGARNHLALADLVALAREIGGEEHHFRVVQLPVNLAMAEAVRLPNQRLPDGRTVPALHAAAELGLSVVGSASLMQAQLTQNLPAAVHEAFPGATTDAQRALAFVRELPVAVGLVGMRSAEHLEENLGGS